MSVYSIECWGWFLISLLEVNKDKDKDDDLEDKQESLEERIKNLNLQDPHEESIDDILNNHEDVRILYYLLVAFVLVALNIVSILLITWYLGTTYKFIYQ